MNTKKGRIKATIKLARGFEVSAVDERIFSGFIEHLGRCIYEGIYEPGHPEADGDGFRRDVLSLVKDLQMPLMRYPGGNFVSGYNWEDGIGPREKRPRRLDLAWKTVETNQFGINEFIDWSKKAGTEPMVAVNLGTRGPDEARKMLEYCNFEGGTELSELRKSHGYAVPHAIKYWCLGNEMDGPWQICSRTAEDYGRIANETAKVMKSIDPDIQLIACGSSGRWMPSYMAWEAGVLEQCYDNVEYLSVHTYYGNGDNNYGLFLSRPDEMGDFIREVVAVCDYIKAKKRSSKSMMLSFDEWNVWFRTFESDKKQAPWQEAPPLLQDAYTLVDALVVGGMMMTLLNNADRVKIACLAQAVNVIAPIMTLKNGKAWKQTIYYPIYYTSKYGRGTVLRQSTESETYSVEYTRADNKKDTKTVKYLLSCCVLNDEGNELTVFALNRSLTDELELNLDFLGCTLVSTLERVELRGDDLEAANTADTSDRVRPRDVTDFSLEKAPVLAPASWNMLRYGVKKA